MRDLAVIQVCFAADRLKAKSKNYVVKIAVTLWIRI